MNELTIVGRVAKEFVNVSKKAGEVFGYSNICVKRTYKNKEGKYESDFFRVYFQGFLAERMFKDVKVGTLLLIKAHLRNRHYQDKLGTTHYENGIYAYQMDFLESKKVVEMRAAERLEKMMPVEEIKITENDLPF